jgi:xanthine/CO dehydrogenase XdhC/CoxF family maturation factor
MADNQAAHRAKLREELAGLKKAALARLECRGYDVRGKTPAQIRQILKRRPSRQKLKGQAARAEPAGPAGHVSE